jgi:hypothetical protein
LNYADIRGIKLKYEVKRIGYELILLNIITSLNTMNRTDIWRNDIETRHPVPFLEAKEQV